MDKIGITKDFIDELEKTLKEVNLFFIHQIT